MIQGDIWENWPWPKEVEYLLKGYFKKQFIEV